MLLFSLCVQVLWYLITTGDARWSNAKHLAGNVISYNTYLCVNSLHYEQIVILTSKLLCGRNSSVGRALD